MAGLYFHIPFCSSKCHYCNFYSVAGRRDLQAYPGLILREMELRGDYLKGEKVQTLYFGGGTPSLLSPEDVDRILTKAATLFSVADDPEITLEANPEQMNAEYLTALKKTGVNRLSLGVQSFHDDLLRYLGRRHTGEQARKALACIADAQFGNVSADLIFGIPGQTDTALLQDVKSLTKSGIQHISAYALTVEERTALQVNIAKNRCAAPDEEQTARQFLLLMETLPAAGFDQYELSNYCLRNFRSRHNSAYWQGIPYLGLGTSAHSFDGNSRQWNTADIGRYRKGIETGQLCVEREELSMQQQLNEYILTSLRTAEGTDIQMIRQRFGESVADQVVKSARPFVGDALLSFEGNVLRLTNAGQLLADRITAALFQLGD